VIYGKTNKSRGTWWCSWLRHCATSQSVVDPIAGGVSGIFHWHDSSSCTMAQGLTQPLNKNECQKYFLEGNGSWCIGLTTLPPSCADCLEIWEPQPPSSSGPVQACTGVALPLRILIKGALNIRMFVEISSYPCEFFDFKELVILSLSLVDE